MHARPRAPRCPNEGKGHRAGFDEGVHGRLPAGVHAAWRWWNRAGACFNVLFKVEQYLPSDVVCKGSEETGAVGRLDDWMVGGRWLVVGSCTGRRGYV